MLLFLYLPPAAGTAGDDAWLVEIAAVAQEWEAAKQLCPAGKNIHLLSLGDFNVQPEMLAQIADPRPRREQGLARLMKQCGLILLNPTVQGGTPRPAWLPTREKWVEINEGDTHHGHGQPRAIDLGLAAALSHGHGRQQSLQLGRVAHRGSVVQRPCPLAPRCLWRQAEA